MAMPLRKRINSASIMARGTTGMRFSRAAIDFRVVGLDRGRGHHHVRTRNVAGRMAHKRTDAQAGQAARGRVVGASEPGHPVAQVGQHSAMPLMPEPPTPTKWMLATACFMRRSSSQASHDCARGHAFFHLLGLLRLVQRSFARQPRRKSASFSGVSSLCCISQPPPWSTRKRALVVWWSVDRERERHERRPRANGRQLGHGAGTGGGRR